MHCASCDKLLSDFEATRKSKETGEYLDLCNRCFISVRESIMVKERLDLLTAFDADDFDEIEEYDPEQECND